MLPDKNLSTPPIIDVFIVPARKSILIDCGYGATTLDSHESFTTLWTCFYEDGYIKITNGESTHIVLTVEEVTALSFAFDLNMRPIIAYSTKFNSYLYWYDTLAGAQVTTELGKDYSFMQLALDDKRSSQSANADVIFAYIKNQRLYMRIQRERFQIEHEITQAKRLIQIGMMKNYRFGFAYYDWD